MIIVVMGPQGSGKSTQAKLLAEELGLIHLSTGDMCRRVKEEETELGRRVRGLLEQGHLAGDEDMVAILKAELARPGVGKGFVIEGFPRNLWQVEHSPFTPDQVFYIKVGDPENMQRLLKRGREDDTEPLIKQRLAEYHQLTEPVLDFYRERGVLVEIDGERAIEPIFEDIKSRLA